MKTTETKNVTISEIIESLRKLQPDHELIESGTANDDTPEHYLDGLICEASRYITFFGLTPKYYEETINGHRTNSTELSDPDYNYAAIGIIPGIDLDQAINIVNCYLDLVDCSDSFTRQYVTEKLNNIQHNYSPDIITLAKQYDTFTDTDRGADDGTYDYAGTYVISILDALNIHLTK